MDILLVVLGFACIIIGILGSFLPVLPGAPISWIGLLLLYLTKAVPNNWWLLGITLVVAIGVVVLDYIIPIAGTKRYGGTKAGMIGTTVGLIVSIVFPVLGLFGIVIWPFVGAFVGELINKADNKTALKAAYGSFLGFLTGTFLKFVVAIVFLGIYIVKVWKHKEVLFNFS
ncbi:DUF456 domain-containing protein [Galbibacter pacificus]|uniref:DUF456 domain-containing protein n=1 Tax=Galbibacter pacificus TaxID=2996052 RepID=A0ABT6FTM8_9FLAO|nr:DUF456 domain-containing protein [Galbibacter pacificus]MDG3583119.1 DUF456 domain-containing protein [Galbibacter pacificus]MDG3586600.1 DUF456 domain-containing protein [Galbibacter pacificus]